MEWPPSNLDLHFLKAWFIVLAVLSVQGEQHNKHNHVVLGRKKAGWRMRCYPTTVHDQHGEEVSSTVWLFWMGERRLFKAIRCNFKQLCANKWMTYQAQISLLVVLSSSVHRFAPLHEAGELNKTGAVVKELTSAHEALWSPHRLKDIIHHSKM